MNLKRAFLLLSIAVCTAGVVSAQTEWVEYPDNPVLGPGEPGEWDDGGRGDPSVMFDGAVFHMWFTGVDASQDDHGFGHATSADGVEWTVDLNNPVLIPGDPGEWDENLWGHPAVVYDGSLFHMWYGGQDAEGTERGGYATSPDGSTWTKYAGNPVLEGGPQGSWDADFTVPGAAMIEDGIFTLWYSGWGGAAGQIGYATSEDGIEWTKLPDPVLEIDRFPGDWESHVALPSVEFDGLLYHMWYQSIDPSLGEWGDVRIGYAYSTDGITWTKHRDNPVLSVDGDDVYCLPVVYDGSTWHGWYSPWHGQVGASGPGIHYTTSTGDPGIPGLTYARYLPAAAYAAGAEGSFYETDLDLSNAGDQEMVYQLLWLPRGQSNTEPTTSEEFTLAAGKSVRYRNVLSEVFGLEPDAFGALVLRSTSPDLLTMARIANIPQDTGTGSFGQAIPALSYGEFTGGFEKRRLLFGTENADMRFNVGCLNADTDPARVNFELFRSDGTLLGSESMLLMPFDNNQLNRIFDPYHPAIGYVDYWSAASSGRIWCYGSVLDNVTSDPTTVPPQ